MSEIAAVDVELFAVAMVKGARPCGAVTFEVVTVQREPCRNNVGPEAVPGTYWICRE